MSRLSLSSNELWLPDSVATECQGCSVAFSLTRRRHHCRACGQLFCSDCSRARRKLPAAYGYQAAEQRVCERCKVTCDAGEMLSPQEALVRRRLSDASPTSPGRESELFLAYTTLGVTESSSSEELKAALRQVCSVAALLPATTLLRHRSTTGTA